MDGVKKTKTPSFSSLNSHPASSFSVSAVPAAALRLARRLPPRPPRSGPTITHNTPRPSGSRPSPGNNTVPTAPSRHTRARQPAPNDMTPCPPPNPQQKPAHNTARLPCR
ncbi:predicted protein [Histoplasma capsulatum var. duboisii H88]|uniref:Predicted protein n=1 Tax=Ajellomyces capsulatus (strain H88) TaxID=544711 RepID=F0UGY5_AJEC8|nr:predicted protein [Histoplasma capsulatum var. duboisii H88]